MLTDRYGRKWDLATEELCTECGQPDNCGDCNHDPLTEKQARELGAFVGPIQIDPPGCGCTECITGEYVPLDEATDEQVWRMMVGVVRNATGFDTSEFRVETTTVIVRPEG